MASEIDDMGGSEAVKALRISRLALAALYGATASLIVESKLVKPVRKALPDDSVTLISLLVDGILCLPSETEISQSDLSYIAGAPIGLKAILCKDASAPAIRWLVRAIEAANLFTPPKICELESTRTAPVLTRLLETFLEANSEELKRFGAITQELAMLRLEHEKTLNQVEKYKRLNEVLSYSHATLTYETPVDIATAIVSDAGHIRQHLPVDLTGLKAVELFTTNIDPTLETAIRLALIRPADSLVVWETTRISKNFTEGWNLFALGPVDPDIYGEVELRIDWDGETPGLDFACSGIEASRFGVQTEESDDHTRNLKTLALKVFQGPTLPPVSNDEILSFQASKSNGELEASNGSASLQISKFSELVSRVNFIHGREEHVAQFNENGFWPMMLNEDQSYMQTHPLANKTCAAILQHGAPSDMTRVGVEVRTAHEAAVPFRYILMRLPADIDSKADAVDGVINKIDDTVVDGVTYQDDVSGIIWSSKVLSAETVGMIEIALDAPKGQTADLVFAVVAATDSIAYGWCRWYSLYTETRILP